MQVEIHTVWSVDTDFAWILTITQSADLLLTLLVRAALRTKRVKAECIDCHSLVWRKQKDTIL